MSRNEVSANIGFALATIKAFMERPGVSAKQVREAIERLESCLDAIDDSTTGSGNREAANVAGSEGLKPNAPQPTIS